MTDDRDDEEGVGYGRPPKATRFKPGQSGNPKGRPKGARGFKAAFNKVTAMPIAITEKGRRITRPAAEVIAQQITIKAAQGDPKMIAQYMQAERLFSDDEPDVTASDPGKELDRDVLKDLMRRMRKYGGGDDV